jgi:hypothetical protein
MSTYKLDSMSGIIHNENYVLHNNAYILGTDDRRYKHITIMELI